MRIGQFEAHMAERQAELRRRAEELCVDLVRSAHPVAILLSGSVARGPVGLASDLDLHIIVNDATSELPVWQFSVTGIIENVHTIRMEVIEDGIACSRATSELAEWYRRTALGDELSGCEVLFVRSGASSVLTDLLQLVDLRKSTEVIAQLAAAHARGATMLVTSSMETEASGYPLEAQQLLRSATQGLLIAALISVGWIIRGSKKRPEIASLYCDTEDVCRAFDLVCEINALKSLTLEQVRRVCQQRLDLRRQTKEELGRLLVDNRAPIAELRIRDEIARAVRHNAGATDYYVPLVDAGCYRGVVNHIRALSGFKDLPAMFLSCLVGNEPPTVDSFLESSFLSEELRATWSDIAQFSPRPKFDEWCRRLVMETKNYTRHS